jgi:hypothetical protein
VGKALRVIGVEMTEGSKQFFLFLRGRVKSRALKASTKCPKKAWEPQRLASPLLEHVYRAR